MDVRERRRRVRRVVGVVLAVVAVAALVAPAVALVRAYTAYEAGYWSRLANGARNPDPTVEEPRYYWRDTAGHRVFGRIADLPFEWGEEYVDGSGTPVWVGPEKVAYLKPPAQATVVLGWAWFGTVVLVEAAGARAWWLTRPGRREDR
ncbi:hypothetical protein ACFV3R_29210 [Streptomyces sp. NPDC059740]|uniref:hypothetical protein n=1 Tax=Streptomyces sp. NPDC059740 TaxID=3346926 RepID=UPI003650BE6C